MSSSFRWSSSRHVRAAIAVGLAMAGVVFIWAALAGPPTPDSALADPPGRHSRPLTSPSAALPTPAAPTAEADEADVRDQITGLVLPESNPVAVSIPKLKHRSTLVEIGLNTGGEMQTPDPADVGWFNRGATPGALGPAVLAGHVTWNGAPAVFHRLDTLRRGDEVAVTRKDGRTAVFTVTRVAQFPKSRFPSRAVYGPIDHAGLRLITCGGTYDAAQHRYLDNVVVFARLVAERKPGRR